MSGSVTNTRVTQSAAEVVASYSANVRSTQAVLEVVARFTANVRSTQVVLEAIVTSATYVPPVVVTVPGAPTRPAWGRFPRADAWRWQVAATQRPYGPPSPATPGPPGSSALSQRLSQRRWPRGDDWRWARPPVSWTTNPVPTTPRTTQAAVEVIASYSAAVRSTQAAIEVLASFPSSVRSTQTALEAIVSTAQQLRAQAQPGRPPASVFARTDAWRWQRPTPVFSPAGSRSAGSDPTAAACRVRQDGRVALAEADRAVGRAPRAVRCPAPPAPEPIRQDGRMALAATDLSPRHLWPRVRSRSLRGPPGTISLRPTSGAGATCVERRSSAHRLSLVASRRSSPRSWPPTRRRSAPLRRPSRWPHRSPAARA